MQQDLLNLKLPNTKVLLLLIDELKILRFLILAVVMERLDMKIVKKSLVIILIIFNYINAKNFIKHYLKK